jgi:hypothetical protein
MLLPIRIAARTDKELPIEENEHIDNCLRVLPMALTEVLELTSIKPAIEAKLDTI